MGERTDSMLVSHEYHADMNRKEEHALATSAEKVGDARTEVRAQAPRQQAQAQAQAGDGQQSNSATGQQRNRATGEGP